MRVFIKAVIAVIKSKKAILEYYACKISIVLNQISLVFSSHLFSTYRRISQLLKQTIQRPGNALAIPLQFIATLWRSRFFSPIDKYKSVKEEQQYWKDAAHGQRVLQQTDARHVGQTLTVRKTITGPQKEITSYVPPLIIYYTPALLPAYRDMPQRWKDRGGAACPYATRRASSRMGIRTGSSSRDARVERVALSAKDYVKWHWMVFPGLLESDHPSLREAHFLKDTHSPEEQKVIYHIAHMLKDYKVFSRDGQVSHKWTPKYKDIWLKWLHSPERKGAEQRAKERS